MPDKRKRRWIYPAALLAWAIWISGVFGNSGVLHAYRLSQARRDLSLRIRALENERQRLGPALSLLESDTFIQEAAIRETLGFVRDGELVFEFH